MIQTLKEKAIETPVSTDIVKTEPEVTVVAPKATAKTKSKKAAPKKPALPATPKGKTDAKIVTPATPAPAAKTTVAPATKPAKANPSQSYIGFKIAGKDAKTVNFRLGKKNTIECNEIRCIGANPTGRRLTVTFHNAKGAQLLERRIYKEFFEKMAKVFGVLLPE